MSEGLRTAFVSFLLRDDVSGREVGERGEDKKTRNRCCRLDASLPAPASSMLRAQLFNPSPVEHAPTSHSATPSLSPPSLFPHPLPASKPPLSPNFDRRAGRDRTTALLPTDARDPRLDPFEDPGGRHERTRSHPLGLAAARARAPARVGRSLSSSSAAARASSRRGVGGWRRALQTHPKSRSSNL